MLNGVADSKPKKKSMDFVPTELTPKQKQLQEQAEKYKKMRMSKVGGGGQRSEVKGRTWVMSCKCITHPVQWH